MDRLERFEMYVLFMLLLIAISLLLKNKIDQMQNRLLFAHESRIEALEDARAKPEKAEAENE